MKKKIIIILFVCILISCCLVFINKKTPYEYLQSHDGTSKYTKANELLYQEQIDDKYIIFYLNENNNISCAVLKKKAILYKILRISSELSPVNKENNFRFSAYEDNGYEWIDWGIITDDTVHSVLANETKMNIINDLPYNFRICWIIGKGEENTPPVHQTKKESDSYCCFHLILNLYIKF